jgi:hypothetical protein
MESWKSLLIAFGLVALFSISLLNFAVIMQEGNNVNNTIISDSHNNLSVFKDYVYGNLTDLRSKSGSYYGNMENETALDNQPQGALTMSTIFHSLTTFGKFIFSFVTSFINLIQIYLGIPSIVGIVLISILSIIVILLFWRLLKQGI